MSKMFKGVLFILLLVWVFPGLSCAESSKDQFKKLTSGVIVTEKPRLYTAYNMFFQHGTIRAINFRVGDFIPIGTPVKVKITQGDALDDFGREVGGEDKIHFKNLVNGKSYILEFTERYHPGKTLYDYASLMFCRKTFQELTASMSPEIIDAIRRSAVIKGMTKEEVILSYGYPAEHRTPSLHGNTWIYWKNRFSQKKICFDSNERTVSCNQRRNQDL